MFKSGDRVVCIETNDKSILKMYKSYKVSRISGIVDYINLEGYDLYLFDYKRFILLQEYRKLKLKKLNYD